MGIFHQKVPGNVIEHGKPHQKQAGTDQTHDHIPGCRDQGPPAPSDHDHSAGGNGIDLYKHIAGKQVVGIDDRQQGA